MEDREEAPSSSFHSASWRSRAADVSFNLLFSRVPSYGHRSVSGVINDFSLIDARLTQFEDEVHHRDRRVSGARVERVQAACCSHILKGEENHHCNNNSNCNGQNDG